MRFGNRAMVARIDTEKEESEVRIHSTPPCECTHRPHLNDGLDTALSDVNCTGLSRVFAAGNDAEVGGGGDGWTVWCVRGTELRLCCVDSYRDAVFDHFEAVCVTAACTPR